MIDNYLKEELLQKVTSLPRLVIVLREDDCCVKYCELRDTSFAKSEVEGGVASYVEMYQAS